MKVIGAFNMYISGAATHDHDSMNSQDSFSGISTPVDNYSELRDNLSSGVKSDQTANWRDKIDFSAFSFSLQLMF